MSYPPKFLKKNEDDNTHLNKSQDLLSALSSIIRFPINTKTDIQKFFNEVVERIFSVIKAEEVTINLKGRTEYNNDNKYC